MAYSTITKPADYFEPVLYTGDDSNNRTINTTENFQADFFWVKDRSNAASHCLIDITRSTFLSTNTTGAEQALSGLGWDNTAPASTGFTVDYGTNPSINGTGRNFVSWCWNAGGTASSNTDGDITSSVSASTTSGFSIVSYTGNGTNPSTIGHGLGKKPDLMIVKSRQDADAWLVGSDKISGWNWSSDYLHLNATSAKMTDAGGTAFNTAPTSSVFSVGTYLNGSGENYIAYMFTSIKGYSKIGTYTGNGSTDGTFIYTGFKPAWVMIKRTSATDNWEIFDSKRNTFNETDKFLRANTSEAEATTAGHEIDLLSNGFKARGTSGNINGSGQTYIYMAFAENPLVSNTGGGIPATAR